MPSAELPHGILAELRGLRADRRRAAPAALIGALEEHFGPGRFTVHGLLELGDSESHTEHWLTRSRRW